MDHEHHLWLADVNRSIVDSYERDQDMARQPKNIQRTGHRVESRWDEVLSDWLPPQYAIGKRKYILLETEDGPATTKETDLVVFHPHSPEKLRSKESVLASGVAAAFSIKRTIDRDAVAEAYKDAATLRRGMKIRDGTLRHRLAPPVFFGLLGESHDWKNADDPNARIRSIVDELDRLEVKAPREGLDMLCVADLGYWVRSTSVLTEKFLASQTDQMIAAVLGREALVMSALRHNYDDPEPLSPLTQFIGSLWAKLAINDPTLKPLADGFRITKTFPASGGLAFKMFKLADVTTTNIVKNVRQGFIPNDDWQYLY
jgi:hypothetical protein